VQIRKYDVRWFLEGSSGRLQKCVNDLRPDKKMKGSTLLVRGLQTLAVATPRSSERDNCIVILVLFLIKIELNRGHTKMNQVTYKNNFIEGVSVEDECRGRGRRLDV